MYKRLLAILLALSFTVFPAYATYAVKQTTEGLWNEFFDQTELSPDAPGSDELDAYLEGVLDDIFLGLIPAEILGTGDGNAISEAVGSLTTYEKTLACYDYVIETVTYGSHMAYLDTAVGSTTCRAIYQDYGAVEGFGAVAMTAGKGMCNAYVSAFILMARKIGLDAYLVTGYTRSGGGGYEYHEWAEIAIGDGIYVFDPQLDESLAAQGLGSYTVFGKTYEQLGNRFDKNS